MHELKYVLSHLIVGICGSIGSAAVSVVFCVNDGRTIAPTMSTPFLHGANISGPLLLGQIALVEIGGTTTSSSSLSASRIVVGSDCRGVVQRRCLCTGFSTGAHSYLLMFLYAVRSRLITSTHENCMAFVSKTGWFSSSKTISSLMGSLIATLLVTAVHSLLKMET